MSCEHVSLELLKQDHLQIPTGVGVVQTIISFVLLLIYSFTFTSAFMQWMQTIENTKKLATNRQHVRSFWHRSQAQQTVTMVLTKITRRTRTSGLRMIWRR